MFIQNNKKEMFSCKNIYLIISITCLKLIIFYQQVFKNESKISPTYTSYYDRVSN